MTIWKNKEEKPEGEGSVFIEIRGETGSFVIASDTLNMIFFNFVRWCWEKDLLAQDKRVEELEEKLSIAVEALREYGNDENWESSEYGGVFKENNPLKIAQQALKEIEVQDD